MHDTLIISLLVGLALAVAAFAVWRLVVELGGAETTYRDRPPSGFRWLWPVVMFVYMIALAYGAAFIVYRIAVALGA